MSMPTNFYGRGARETRQIEEAKARGDELYEDAAGHVFATSKRDGIKRNLTLDTTVHVPDPPYEQHYTEPTPGDSSVEVKIVTQLDAAIRLHYSGDKQAAGTDDDYRFAMHLHNVLEKLELLLLSKRMDYGSDNLRRRGQLGVLMQLENKLARADNLIEQNKPAQNETLNDTWRDIAGYAILALLLDSGTIEGGRKGVGK